MTTYNELQRYICPICQKTWVTVKDAPCEDCYGIGWDRLMAEALKGTLRVCGADDCPNPAVPPSFLCQDHEHEEVMEQCRRDSLFDAEVDRRIDEYRGK